MEQSSLTTIVLPLSLAIIMMGMGLSLTIKDFQMVTKYPKASLVGLLNQLVLLPIIGFFVATIFNLDPYLAVGVMIIASCPGGPTSNLITFVAKGDVALSVTLTAVTSFVTLFTIPLVLNFSLNYFSTEAVGLVTLPFWDTLKRIFLITIIPISIGMIIRSSNPILANKLNKPFKIGSIIIFLAILAGIILANRDKLVSSMQQVGMATLLLNILTMFLGYAMAKLTKLNLKQRLTIAIESGIQNGTLAIVIATTIIMNADMAIPPGVYSLLMFVTGGILMYWFGRRKEVKS